ncbi:hypothetical protein [Arachidicoccus ginsenosidimutans]|uniref:hypothetical protein n=1 Tax=Arachidicoccus sp. BS20 TaxID=1850526 RepID=UPI0012E83ACE|nr:hypothetical protein [Arachidicoccus sp. BS20]
MKKKNLLFSTTAMLSGVLLFSSCSKTPSDEGQKIAPQEFYSSTELVVTPGHLTDTTSALPAFTADGASQTYYVDALGQYYTINGTDTSKAETPTLTFSADHDYQFQINFRDEDGQISNDEYTDESSDEDGAAIHQFFFVPVASGSVTPVTQTNDDGDKIDGYVNLTGLEDHGGLSYFYGDKGTKYPNQMIGLNGYFHVLKAGESFDMVVDLRHGIQDKFSHNYPWYDADFSSTNPDNVVDVNQPYGATDFATLFHMHVQTTN